MGLFDPVAAASGTAQHLLEKDARTNTSDKDQIADLGHVDAGGEQIHGDGDVGQAFVLKLADHTSGLSMEPVILMMACRHGHAACFESFFEYRPPRCRHDRRWRHR